jgi:hypothetical protein
VIFRVIPWPQTPLPNFVPFGCIVVNPARQIPPWRTSRLCEKPPRASPQIDYRCAEHEHRFAEHEHDRLSFFLSSVVSRRAPDHPFPISVIFRVIPWPQTPLPNFVPFGCIVVNPARQIPLGELCVFARNPRAQVPESITAALSVNEVKCED